MRSLLLRQALQGEGDQVLSVLQSQVPPHQHLRHLGASSVQDETHGGACQGERGRRQEIQGERICRHGVWYRLAATGRLLRHRRHDRRDQPEALRGDSPLGVPYQTHMAASAHHDWRCTGQLPVGPVHLCHGALHLGRDLRACPEDGTGHGVQRAGQGTGIPGPRHPAVYRRRRLQDLRRRHVPPDSQCQAGERDARRAEDDALTAGRPQPAGHDQECTAICAYVHPSCRRQHPAWYAGSQDRTAERRLHRRCQRQGHCFVRTVH